MRNDTKSEIHLEIQGGSREGIGMKHYLHDPKDFAKTLKLRFRIGILDLSEETVPPTRYTNGLEGEEVDAKVCP